MKKSLALLLTLAMVFSMVLPVGAFSFETVETVVGEPLTEESAEPAAALAADVVIGKNLFTGTADLLTFDDESQADLFNLLDNLSKSVVSDPVSLTDGTTKIDPDGKYGNMLQLHRDANAPRQWTGYTLAQKFDGSRAYWLTWDERIDMKDLRVVWGVIMSLNGANKHQDIGMANAMNKWRHYSATTTPNSNEFRYWCKITNVQPDNNDQSVPTEPTNWYIDNFGLYPMYKITYVLPDGTTKVDNYLFADGVTPAPENIATEYTPKNDYLPETFSMNGKLYKTIGWATTENAADAVDTIALAGEDVTLYPVYEVTELLSADALAIKVNGTTTVTAKEPVKWTYDVGFTGATVETTETTATVTAAGENGTIKLSATLVSDESVTVDVTISVLGSANWRPGHNVFNGTENAFDFENMSDDAIYAVFGKKSQVAIQDNANKSGINFSDRVLYLGTTGGYPSVWNAVQFAPISKERPLFIEYDYYGKFDCHWIMINGAQASDIYKNMGAAGYSKTDAWKHVRLTNQKSEATTKHDSMTWIAIELGNSNVYAYFDNFNVIPYYQITYKNFDGTDAKVEYVLLDTEGNFLTSYTPELSVVPGAVAYATSEDGDPVETVALNHEDIVFYPLKSLKGPITYTDGTKSEAVNPDYTKDYTIPAPADLGFELENFIAWRTPNGQAFYPNSVVKAADMDAIKGLTLTAFCQNLTQPAMGYSYEGNTAGGISKYAYQEIVEDEGRTVNHLRLFRGTYDAKGSRWQNDARLTLGKESGFDASEYNILQYNYKITSSINVTSVSAPAEPSAAQLTGEIKNPGVTIYCMYDKNTFYGAGGTMMIGSSAANTLINDKQYHVVELDMSTSEHQSSSRLWTGGKDGKLYGFAFDINRAYYSGDTYVDYIRVYRDGVFTVNYDTNVPDGYDDLVENEVAPDTGRGGGTGYLLKGEHPAIEDLIFRGWALTPDATPEETVEAIDLTGDTTVYAVWEDAPKYPNVDKDNVSIRSGSDKVNGIRFASSISASDRSMMEEYGFIIAREDILGTNELTFAFKAEDANKPLYVYGAAYDKKNGIDYQYDIEGNKIIFTAVCTNIPAEHYATKLVARTYAKYAVSGSTFTVYGSSVTKSVKEIAQSIKDAGGAAYEDNKDYIDSILG